MLHTKFCGNRPAGSGEENFEGFSPYMGMAAMLGMWPASHKIFHFNIPKSLHTKLG